MGVGLGPETVTRNLGWQNHMKLGDSELPSNSTVTGGPGSRAPDLWDEHQRSVSQSGAVPKPCTRIPMAA